MWQSPSYYTTGGGLNKYHSYGRGLVSDNSSYTDQGVKAIRNAPLRIEAAIKGFETMGGKVTGFYATMGEYDYVPIGEAPNDTVSMTFLLGLGLAGNVRTTTLKAFTKEEFVEIVKNLP